MSRPAAPIAARAARVRAGRAARTYARASFIETEVAGRMVERLDVVRLAPRRVLDAGAGGMRDVAALGRRYPGATFLALDASSAMLRAAPRLRAWITRLAGRKPPIRICADMTQLPLADASIGLVWSNMALHYVADPLAAFREFWRVLEPGGLLMFSTLGPDTLKELRAAAGARRVHEFIDMHDLGDQLVAAGFQSPILDMEMITLTYAHAEGLLRMLRETGQTNTRADRPRGLAGRAFLAQLESALCAAARNDRIPASFEILQGHAWKGAHAPTRGAEHAMAAKPIRILGRARERE